MLTYAENSKGLEEEFFTRIEGIDQLTTLLIVVSTWGC